MRSSVLVASTALLLCCARTPARKRPPPPASKSAKTKPKTIADKSKAWLRIDGFVPLYWDDDGGRLWMEITRWNEPLLYLTSLTAGAGSNDLGFDRGRIGFRKLVRFVRSGKRVLLIEDNLAFRANTANPDEARAVDEAFAKSVVWGFDIEIREGDKALIDATDFVLRDANLLGPHLSRRKQGNYSADNKRSAIYLPRTKGFEKNTEIETWLTMTLSSGEPGTYVRSVTPDARAMTVRQRHSFIELPGPGYRPRPFDPNAGLFYIDYVDYATPIASPLRKRFVIRHRLERGADGKIAQPLVYYVDRGAPEPIRSALIDGARWWEKAFEAAGWPGAFRVELMPEGADPMDVRYNVIQWVHRSTRGWSYGDAVVDPRTGEIIKGHISLGSLRVRQDYLIAEGLLAPYESGKPVSKQMEQLALARLRQLSAHEVGHTLGVAHNFAASPSNRASVMDYPHPWVRLDKDGNVDVSQAYAVGIGAWDTVAIDYGYREIAGDEAAGLAKILADARQRGLQYITDADARPIGGAHPGAHLWDNGADPVEELESVLEVRKKALERFSANVIKPGQPDTMLEEALVPIYLFHRYQVEAAVKLIGGVHYTYTRRGDGQPAPKAVEDDVEDRALQVILTTLDDDNLELPDDLNIPPRADGFHDGQRERFGGHTGLTFDPLEPARASASHTVRLLLAKERAERLAQKEKFSEMLEQLTKSRWRKKGSMWSRAADDVVLTGLLRLASDARASHLVRARASDHLENLRRRLSRSRGSAADNAHYRYAVERIRKFQDGKTTMQYKLPKVPPGSPIGCGP